MVPVETISSILEYFNDAVLFRLVAEEAFRAGFCWAAFLALLVGMFSRFFLYFWKPIKAFFAPTKSPATNSGPSPFSRMMSCLTQILIFVLVVVLVGAALNFIR